jgi:hypothetical protein
MTSCGSFPAQLGWWVNLRLTEPHQDIIGRNLQVTIGGLPSQCGINQGNPSLLSCFASKDVTYPANIVVVLDGVEVNNFTINPNSAVCDSQPTATREVDPVSETPSAVSTP